MNSLEIIGLVAREHLRETLNFNDTTDAVARFLLDRLTGAQVAEICNKILEDQALFNNIDIKIPISVVEGYALPQEILTAERTVFWRNAPCAKPAILLANTNDDQGQSLRDVTSLGAREIKNLFSLWVDVASKDLSLSQEHLKYWQQALKGLQAANDYSLEQFAKYVSETRHYILEEGLPVGSALGRALPALRLPRDSGYFEAIADKMGQLNKWQAMFQQAISKRGCLLIKETSSRKLIDTSELKVSYEGVKDEIPAKAHPAIEAFIESTPGWNEQAKALSEFEWEQDNINSIFSGLRVKKVDLASTTLQFYEDEFPDVLIEDDKKYLSTLSKRTTKEALEEDKNFYDNHRQEMERDRSLKTRWDKFVYGQAIECTDFLIGLVAAIERLFDRLDQVKGKKSLVIKTHKQKSKSKWLELNADVGNYFCIRYRGLEVLTSPEIIWDTHWLFKYDQLLKESRQKPKYKKNTSTAKPAIEIIFYVEMHINNELVEKTQLIWKCNPNGMGMELHDDLERLAKAPFVYTHVSRELVSKKGRLQSISLKDVGTLMAAFRQDRGSLVGAYSSSQDLAKIFPTNLKRAQKEQHLDVQACSRLDQAWKDFINQYFKAISSLLDGEGVSSESLITQCESYQKLLDCLIEDALGDLNRKDLLAPVLRLGCVRVDRGKPAAIIAPWHPLRLAGIAIKTRQLTRLIKYILNTELVDFGDSKLFFTDLKTELLHPYYPEVGIGYAGEQPLLLSISDTFNDYSLLERPVKDSADQTTNEDPITAATNLLALTKRYLELLPHERTNLSIVLYNCDSTRLPQAIVEKISTMDESNEEVRCQVILRHQEAKKLNKLYQEMLESSDADPDAFVASEISRDFMAKLRIGVMADSAPLPDQRDGKPSDIIFLQDVISRQAKEVWQSYKLENTPALLEHVPSRWSRKRPFGKGELKSTVFLVCPSQPAVGLTYLKTIYSVINGEDVNNKPDAFPARQIMFQDESTKTIFDEVHRLAEWVVNYDDLLDRRQLVNQGVKVIRYRQSRSDERNLLVSSKTSLNLLHVLIRRRLEALNLGLDKDEIEQLTEKFINEANALSGDIVLRAAKRGKFASELIGVVLSKLLIASELGNSDAIGWYFLDDYASWLGQKEEQIADILAISPQIIAGQSVLKMIISEAKYTDPIWMSEARKTSQKQLRDTVSRMSNAIFGNPGRLDRDLWLSKISDLLLNGLELNTKSELSIDSWRDNIRAGTIPIDLLGYSHVFVSGIGDKDIQGEQCSITKVDRCYQEIFTREHVRQIILAYHKGQSLSIIREQLGSEKPWQISQPQLPAPRVSWTNNFTNRSITESIKPLNLPEPPSNITSPKLNSEESNLESTKTGSIIESPALSPIEENESIAISEKNIEDNGLTKWLANKSVTTIDDPRAEQWLNDTVITLRNALINYTLQAKVLGQRLTPNAAIVRLKGSDYLKIEDIERKRSQLLTTHSLNIISILGQPGEILVSIARPQRQQISLTETWAKRKLNRSSSGINLSLIVGVKEIDGELLYLNLGSGFEGLQQHAPHTLIAGATGSGKSVLLRNLLLDICATNTKELANIYLIDPKAGVDYFFIEDMPHLTEGIIIDQQHSIAVLERLVAEMDNRYLKFREQKVSNLLAYNDKVSPNERLPVLWLVHDEFAEWMLVNEYKEAVSSVVQRLGVKARAAGIYLIFAAQRPDASVLPVQLRDNLGNRLILRVESVGTSEIALGQKGAEHLLGRGHLAARLSGESDIIYAQVPFLSDEDLFSAAEAIKENG